MLLYLVQRTDCTGTTVAADIDPAYAAALNAARAAGVEVLAYRSLLSCQSISIGPELPVH